MKIKAINQFCRLLRNNIPKTNMNMPDDENIAPKISISFHFKNGGNTDIVLENRRIIIMKINSNPKA